MGKIVLQGAHGAAPAGTHSVVQLGSSSMASSVEVVQRSAPASVDSRLTEQVFGLVYRQMHALWGKHRGDFDDLVQVASEQAVRAIPSFRGDSELSTWTYRICYHTVKKHQRWSSRWLRRFTLDAPQADTPVRAPAVGELLEEHERSARLHAALDRLSAKRRAVVVLRDLEELDISEIASIVETSEATVRSRLRDARKDLARLLERDPYFGRDACEETP